MHLLGDALVSLAHGLDFGADNITGHSERAGFRGSEGFARELQELLGVIFLDGGAGGVKGFQFVVGDLCKVHAVQQGPDAGVIFAPKVVGDWELSVGVACCGACMSRVCVHESVTVGTSDVDEPGMMPAVYRLERVLSVAARSTYTGTASVAKNAGVAIYGVTMAPQGGAWMARVHKRLILELNCVYGQRFPGRRAGRSARTRC